MLRYVHPILGQGNGHGRHVIDSDKDVISTLLARWEASPAVDHITTDCTIGTLDHTA